MREFKRNEAILIISKGQNFKYYRKRTIDYMTKTAEKIHNKLDEYRFINSDTLKCIAILTMLIDHIAAGLLLYFIRNGNYLPGLDFNQSASVYHWMRHIGRQAFPIYCFLIVEGLAHTRSVVKYLVNLGIFGLLSEPFFDLALKVKISPFSTDIFGVMYANEANLINNCNVYFTLMIGLFVIWVMKYVEDNLFSDDPSSPFGISADHPLYIILYGAPAVAGAVAAQLLGSDYRWWGIVLIAVFFAFRRIRSLACFAGYIFFMNMGSEVWALPAFILIFAYSGKRGSLSKKFKYVFYAFYPLHLLLIYLLRCYIYARL